MYLCTTVVGYCRPRHLYVPLSLWPLYCGWQLHREADDDGDEDGDNDDDDDGDDDNDDDSDDDGDEEAAAVKMMVMTAGMTMMRGRLF